MLQVRLLVDREEGARGSHCTSQSSGPRPALRHGCLDVDAASPATGLLRRGYALSQWF